MKTGKRLAACLLAAVMVLTGCGAKDGGEPAALEGDLETILEEIYAGVDNEETKEFLEGFGQGEITAENVEYYLGSKDVAFAEGLYSEPLINAINIGLPIIECAQAARSIEDGDEVEVDFDSGLITNKTKGETYQGQSFPEFMQKIITAGGLVNYINSQ